MTAVMSLNEESRSRVKTVAGASEAFDIRVGVHQSTLFITVMKEKLTRGDSQ